MTLGTTMPFTFRQFGLASSLLFSTIISGSASAHDIPNCGDDCPPPRIQLALLLDTSNSMDGLIAQTKSQMWMLVNELGETARNGETPKIELALYEYGNSNISVSKGYIRQVMPLTTDLDGVSEKLFALKTRGGQEFAGQVISTAIDNLEWSDEPADMKLVIIAGNEPFTQGPVNYETACARAQRKGVIIDTIHCGDEQTGIRTMWKAGADCGGGIYMTINQDDVAEFIPSPYDKEILDLNQKLNTTYYGYGTLGVTNKARQVAQDSNATSMGFASSIARAKSKSSAQYDNSAWDALDLYKSDKDKLLDLDDSELPEEMKGMSRGEREAFMEKKVDERDGIASKIADLEEKRSKFVQEAKKNTEETKTLEEVVVSAVRGQAKAFGFQ